MFRLWRFLRYSPSIAILAACFAVIAVAFLAALLEHGAAVFVLWPVFAWALGAVLSIWLVYALLGWFIARTL